MLAFFPTLDQQQSFNKNSSDSFLFFPYWMQQVVVSWLHPESFMNNNIKPRSHKYMSYTYDFSLWGLFVFMSCPLIQIGRFSSL